MDNPRLSWAAGFFEGEGYIGLEKQFLCKNKRYYPRLKLAIAQVHREPLDAFQKVFNLGKVRGPYGPYQTNRKAHYQFAASGEDAKNIVQQLIPYLFQKGIQAKEALIKYEEYTNGRA